MEATLPLPRRASGWILLHVRDVDGFEGYSTSLPVTEEVWLRLHQFSEVRERGVALVRRWQSSLPPDDAVAVWREFRAYLRQAEAFFRAAAPLPWKSAPLNYYYAFLNLAKGVLTLRAQLPAGKVGHGLTHERPAPDSATNEWRMVVREGIFSKLYQQQTGTAIPIGSVLNFRTLLGWVHSVSYTYEQSGFGPSSVSQGFAAALMNETEAWPLLALPKSLPLSQDAPLGARLRTVFRQVDQPKDSAREFFGLHAVASNDCEFFESIDTTPLDSDGGFAIDPLLARIGQALSVSPTLARHDIQLRVNCPYDLAGTYVPMNELLATYACMFFMSELIRYVPERLDHVGDTHDGWLVESFVASAPEPMMRMMLSAVVGKTFLILKE